MVPRRAVGKIGPNPTASRTGEGHESSDTRAQQAMRMMAVSGPVDSFLMRMDKINWTCEGPATPWVLVVVCSSSDCSDDALSGAHGVRWTRKW